MRKRGSIEEIYLAALKVFGRYGYRKATLGDIAAELGMTQGNLYLYVKNKKDLYQRSVGYALLRWQGRVREAVARESDPREQFVVMCRKAVEYLSLDDDFRRVLVHDPEIFPMFPRRDPYERINRNSMSMIRAILRRGIEEKRFRAVNLRTLPQLIFSIYKMFIIRMYIRAEGRAMQRMFEETLDMITKGLFMRG
jgi:AcrR family transcriptional regulator